MNNLVDVKSIPTLDSREVAEMVGKSHSHLLRDVEKYIEYLNKSEKPKLDSQNFFVKSAYKTEGNNKTYLCYLVTRKGCEMIANKLTGEKGVLFTATYIDKFHEMENQLKDSFMIENPIERAERWIEEQKEKQNLLAQIEQDKPKVVFADAVTTSKTSILVGELAKLLRQNGIDIGQNRLFKWLRENGYLIKRKGTDYNMPTQKSMDSELFEIKETSICHNGHTSIGKTSKVTGKGQVYFINKFKKNGLESR